MPVFRLNVLVGSLLIGKNYIKTNFSTRESSVKENMFNSKLVKLLGVSQLLKQSDWAQIQDFK